MRLPHAEQAVVPLEKIEDYLLNPGHPIGGSKAAFFRAFGFSREEWRLLAEALREHGRANPRQFKPGRQRARIIHPPTSPTTTPSRAARMATWTARRCWRG